MIYTATHAAELEARKLELALATVKAAGYRVTKPRKAKAPAPTLNAVGKPYGANYDPNYRMRYRTPPLKRTMGHFPALGPVEWERMVKEAGAVWEARAEAEAKAEAAKLAA